jgi:hypothetical protein
MFNPYIFRLAELLSEDFFLVDSVPINTYLAHLETCRKFPIMYRNEQVGGAVMNENKFHIAVLPKYRGRVGREILRAIEWGFSINNPFIGIVSASNTDALKLVKRYPYSVMGVLDSNLVFMITKRGN